MTAAARPFLDAIGDRAAAALELDAVIRRWPAGSVLFHEGDHADRVLLLRGGRVKLVASDANGTTALLAVRGPGELVGELAAVDESSRLATAIAMEPVDCAVIRLVRTGRRSIEVLDLDELRRRGGSPSWSPRGESNP